MIMFEQLLHPFCKSEFSQKLTFEHYRERLAVEWTCIFGWVLISYKVSPNISKTMYSEGKWDKVCACM